MVEEQKQPAPILEAYKVKKQDKPILLEYMIGLGFVVFLLMTAHTQGWIKVKQLEQKQSTSEISPRFHVGFEFQGPVPEKEVTGQQETASSFGWDETSVLL